MPTGKVKRGEVVRSVHLLHEYVNNLGSPSTFRCALNKRLIPCCLRLCVPSYVPICQLHTGIASCFNWVQAATDMHPACPNKKQNHLQNSFLRRAQFWVRKTFSKPASLKRASLVPLVIAALLWSRAQRHWVGLELRFGCVLMAELHGLLRSTVCHV